MILYFTFLSILYLIIFFFFFSFSLNVKYSYLYVGTVVLDKEDGIEILNLLLASNELGLYKLANHVGDFLEQHQKYLFKKYPIEMIDIIFSHDLFAYLREFCLETLCAEPFILLGTDLFKSI